MSRPLAALLYLVVLAAVVIGVDLLFFRDRAGPRLAVNVGIVIVFAVLYLVFLNRPR